MSKPWRVAASLAAAVVFAATILSGTPVVAPLVDLPLLLAAAYGGLVAFVLVWMLEAVYLAARWVRRKLVGTSSVSGG